MVVELKKFEPSKTWARGTDQITSAHQAKPGLFPAVKNYESMLWKTLGLGLTNSSSSLIYVQGANRTKCVFVCWLSDLLCLRREIYRLSAATNMHIYLPHLSGFDNVFCLREIRTKNPGDALDLMHTIYRFWVYIISRQTA